MNTRACSFAGGTDGAWRVTRISPVIGPTLPEVARLQIGTAPEAPALTGAVWVLRGVTSNERYVTRPEKDRLLAVQPPLGRPEATCAALIPIRKNADWWALTQDERRRVFEERSKHIVMGLKHLPAVARRLHHCRDFGQSEPFDFLTWFEYAPADSAAFDALLAELRASEEWTYVEREVDIRVIRE